MKNTYNPPNLASFWDLLTTCGLPRDIIIFSFVLKGVFLGMCHILCMCVGGALDLMTTSDNDITYRCMHVSGIDQGDLMGRNLGPLDLR
jgi:hypothetical protein